MIVAYNSRFIKLPDFLIVGAARAGTTALYSYLSEHPQIFLPEEKEPMFFSQWGQDSLSYKCGKGETRSAHIISHLDEYLSLFSTAEDEACIGEASTWYLYLYETAIHNIKKLYGEQSADLKIIVILRNPADRAWSHYSLFKTAGREDLDFIPAIDPKTIQSRLNNNLIYTYDYIGFGRYYAQVKVYMETFPKIKIFIYEDFFQDISRLLPEIYHFLGVDPEWTSKRKKRLLITGRPKNTYAALLEYLVFKQNFLSKHLKSLIPAPTRKNIKYSLGDKIYKKNFLSRNHRDILIETFKDDIQKLSELLNTDLPHWME